MRPAASGSWSALGLLAALLITAPSDATAQDLQNFDPAPGTWSLLSVSTAETGPEGELVPSLWLHYANNPLVRRSLSTNEVIGRIVEHYLTADVLASYALTDWAAIAVGLPISYTDGEQIELLGGSGAGIGDLRVIPTARLPERLGDVLGLALTVPVIVPTGDPDKGMGADTVQVQPTAVADVKLPGITFAANLGYRYRADTVTVDTLSLGDELVYGAGLAAELTMPELLALAEVYGSGPLETLDSPNDAPLELLLAVRYLAPFGGVFTAGGGFGLITGGYGAPDFRLIFGFGWAAPEPVVAPPRDDCPDQPEDEDGFEDEDGCPDPDNDGDGVLDVDDECPNDPEDKDGFEDANGCPDPDNDQDGLLDAEDQCPNDPEDKDGFEDANGCPDPDNDQDGFLDPDDACPNEPETVNEYKDDDGCPDRKVEVKVTEEKLEILENVFFDFDKATIKPESFPVLDAVAETLAKNAAIRVRVEGHTDQQGTHEYNDTLSQARAESVVAYLVEKGGIAQERLEPKGFGKRQPLVDPNQPGADAKNRRVEFVIIR